MSTILLYESDAVFSAVLEDHLRVAGHQVVRVQGLAEVLARTRTESVDLMVLDGPIEEIQSAVGMLRRASETRATPILVLAPGAGREARLASLRAGADEHLGRPLDLEELMLRTERLLGRRSPAPQLAGDLGGHPLPDLLQYVQQTGKSGRLTVADSRGRGEAAFSLGQLVTARWGRLRGSEAALAMLSLETGTFRFENDSPDRGRGGSAGPLPLQHLLLHAVWLTDEIAARRKHLPATGAPLVARTATAPAVGRSFTDLPIARIFERIRVSPGVRLYDLIADEMEAPAVTRLGVAWLIEQGAVAEDESGTLDAPPSTGEISSSMLFEVNIAAFLTAAKAAGLDADPLPLLVVADEACRPQVIQMLQGVHGYLKNEPLRTLVERLGRSRGASSAFACERGRLSMHVQLLGAEERTPLDGVVPVCAGVLLWLASAAIPAAAQRIVARLEASRTIARGIIVAADQDARSAAEALIEGAERWQISSHEPKSLLGVLRLLELSR